MNRLIALICVLALTLISHAESFIFGTATNPSGVSINVDSYGFIIGGKRVVPVMGEIHYSRVPQQDWQREIRKMRAGGITILSTYVFWIHHEATEGVWNWTGNRNLHAFLNICKEEQMPVVLRIGPFCHGEVIQGGIPTWLVKKAQENPKDYKLRSEAQGFIDATQRLYSNIYAQTSDMLWKHGGPIIGIQIENECRGPWHYYMRLKDMAVSIGFDVPFYTRTGWPKLNGKEEFGKLLPLYGDYADGFWDRKLTDMPGDYPMAFIMKDNRMSSVIATETFSANELKESSAQAAPSTLSYPYLTCELGGGMMPAYHRRINMSGNEAFPLAICKLGSGSNLPGYYMYHGGTNPTVDEVYSYSKSEYETMGETQLTTVTNYNDMPYMSYDFQAPLGEMGQPLTTAFHQTRWLHQFLADWGEELATMPAEIISEKQAKRGYFEFYNDYVRIINEQGKAYVRPIKMPFHGHIITATAQPFCKIGNTLYLIPIKGMNTTLTLDDKNYSPKPNKALKIADINIILLSEDKARRAYKIDDTLVYAKHDGGILYKDGNRIIEEFWSEYATQPNALKVSIATNNQNEAKLRTIPMGAQRVASMPTNADFNDATMWTINIDSAAIKENSVNVDNLFLSIEYAGDCARIYADGKLIEDNFWNGKPMLVRMSKLIGHKVELRMFPLAKDAPIYLQQEQKQELEAAQSYLLKLKNITVIQRETVSLN